MSRIDFYAQLATWEPTVRQAFLQAIADITSNARLTVVASAIERGDIEAAIVALSLDETFFAPLDRQIETAFYQGGVWQLANLPKRPRTLGPLVIRFGNRNPRAEQAVRQQAGNLITEVVEDTKQAVRETLLEGAGRNPRQIALDLVGRMDGGTRKGGLIGLHSKDARAVQRMRDELSDPETASGYFRREARDRRFDGTVRKAIKAGRPVARADIERMAGRYADRLLKLRGDTIARTETVRAFNAGRWESMTQLVERGEVAPEYVTLTWDATGDRRTRPDHMAMEGQEVGFGQPFTFPDGSQALFPGDTSLGAPAKQTIACRCYAAPRIDWIAQARAA